MIIVYQTQTPGLVRDRSDLKNFFEITPFTTFHGGFYYIALISQTRPK